MSRCPSSQDQDVAGLWADALARRRKRSQDQLTPALMPLLRGPEPGDDLDGFPVLARTIKLNEPRVPIGDLGFTEGYALLDVGENVQKGISMHAAQYTMASVSWALKSTSASARTPWRHRRRQAGQKRPVEAIAGVTRPSPRRMTRARSARFMRVKTRDAVRRPLSLQPVLAVWSAARSQRTGPGSWGTSRGRGVYLQVTQTNRD